MSWTHSHCASEKINPIPHRALIVVRLPIWSSLYLSVGICNIILIGIIWLHRRDASFPCLWGIGCVHTHLRCEPSAASDPIRAVLVESDVRLPTRMLGGSPAKIAPGRASGGRLSDTDYKLASATATEKGAQHVREQYGKVRMQEDAFAHELKRKGEREVLGRDVDVVEFRHSMFELSVLATKIDNLQTSNADEAGLIVEMKQYIASARQLRISRQAQDAGDRMSGSRVSSSSATDPDEKPAPEIAEGSRVHFSEAPVRHDPRSSGRSAARAPARAPASTSKKQRWGRASSIDRGSMALGRRSSLSSKLDKMMRAMGGGSAATMKTSALIAPVAEEGEEDEEGSFAAAGAQVGAKGRRSSIRKFFGIRRG